jgi:hypothetical protein
VSPLTVRTRSRMLLVEIFFFLGGGCFSPASALYNFFSPFARLILHIQAEIGVLH